MTNKECYLLTEKAKEVLARRKGPERVYGFVNKGKLYISMQGIALVMKTDMPDTEAFLRLPKNLSTLEGFLMSKGKPETILKGDKKLKDVFARPKWNYKEAIGTLVKSYEQYLADAEMFIPKGFMDMLEYRKGHHAIVIQPQDDGTLHATGVSTAFEYRGAKVAEFSIAPALFKEIKTLSATSVAISKTGVLISILDTGVIMLVLDKNKQKEKEKQGEKYMESTTAKKVITPAELAAQTQKLVGLTQKQTADLAASPEVATAIIQPAPQPVEVQAAPPVPVSHPVVEDVSVDATGQYVEPVTKPAVKKNTGRKTPTEKAKQEKEEYDALMLTYSTPKGLVQAVKDMLVDVNKVLTYQERCLKHSADETKVKGLEAEVAELRKKADKYDKLKALIN